MGYAFAGVAGRGDGRALPILRRALGGVGRVIDAPFAGFVHCVSLSPGFEATEDDHRALLAASRRLPGETLAWIEVDCFGGACGQQGFLIADGAVTHVEPQAMDTATGSALMRLLARAGAALPSPTFAPFERGYFNFDDTAWMGRALALARRQLGRVAPNPAVGCVIADGRELISEAATGDGGRPHAEELALDLAGERAEGATAYVTLEPCSARSSGAASCAERLVDARIGRVVIACPDPNPTATGGADLLRRARLDVDVGVLIDEAQSLNAGFFKRLSTGRPLVALSPVADGFDAECRLQPDETVEAMMDRMGREGMTRTFARPRSREAELLAAAGLFDPYGEDNA